MTVRGQMLELKKAIRDIHPARATPGLVKLAACFLNLLLGLLTSTAQVFGSLGPFGIGFVAQSGGGLGGFAALVGAASGYLLIGGAEWGIKYTATVALVFAVSFVLQDTKIRNTSWFMPLVAAVIALFTSFLNSFETWTQAPSAVPILTETVLAGGSTYFFRIALTNAERTTESEELRYGVSFMILLGVALMSLSGIVLLDVISVGRVAALLIIMTVSLKNGLTSGSAAGAALGLAMDMACGGVPFFTMAYAFSGLISGVFSKGGRLIFVLSYIAANTVAVVWTWNQGLRIEALYETFVAAVVFVLLPRRLLAWAGTLLQQAPVGSGEIGLRKYCAGRIRRMGEAFSELFEIVHRTLDGEKNDNDVATVFDRAADAVCVNCKNKEVCWQKNYMDTLSVMNDATPAMMQRGKLVKEDLPTRFFENCQHGYAFVAAVNAELRGLMYRRQFRARLTENRTAAYEQYADMAQIMEGVSAELGSAAGSDHLAERRLLRYLRTLDIEAEVSVFRDRSGRLRAVIESARVPALLREPEYLEKMSSILGVRLCRPNARDTRTEGRLLLLEAEPLAVSVGIAAMKKKGEPVSGDRGTYFKTEQGVLCVILSDGMGSGENAAKESQGVIRILETFLRSGVAPETAMKLLNSAMLLKNGEDWGYATVDLACIDLFTGETCFYKYGAAPSYVKSGKTLRRVRGESMAAGVYAGEAAAPDVVRMHLRPGSVAVIASDGVLAEEDDRWLRQILAAEDCHDAKALARNALKAAVREFGCADDMTVMAVYVDERK